MNVMKNINKLFLIGLFIAAGCISAACSDNDENSSAEVTFTQPEGIDTALLDEVDEIVGSFEVEATGNWHIYSNRMWTTVSLSSDGGFYNDIQGVAGKYTVYVKVTNEARGFNESSAEITILAGEKTKTVATVVRSGKNYKFEALDSEGNVLKDLAVGYEARAWVDLAANFDCSIIGYPQWMNEPQVVDGGFELTVAEAFVPMPQNGNLLFGNVDGSIRYELPVSYSGMDPQKLVIEGDYAPWGWNVTLDGKTFSHETNSPSGETVATTVEDKIDFTVKCLNFDCKFIVAEVRSGVLIYESKGEPLTWIGVAQDENDKSAVSVSVEPFTATGSAKSRSGYVFAVPAGAYDNFMDSLKVGGDAIEFIDNNQDFVLIELTQANLEDSSGFSIKDADDNDVACNVEEEYYEWLCSEFSITDVTTCTLANGMSYTINTKLTSDDWAKNYGFTDLEGNNIRPKNWNLKVVEGEDGYYRVTITVPETFAEPVILRLYSSQIINIKALVIRPETNK